MPNEPVSGLNDLEAAITESEAEMAVAAREQRARIEQSLNQPSRLYKMLGGRINVREIEDGAWVINLPGDDA